MDKRMVFAFLIISTLFMLGCVSSLDSSKENKIEVKVEGYDSDKDPCASGAGCTCMVCFNATKSGFFSRVLNWIKTKLGFESTIVSSMRKGYCYFDNDCNYEKIDQIYMKDDPNTFTANYQVRTFMVGQGPSFTAFDESNTYCDNSMTLAVKWLIGRGGETPRIPKNSRAACYLDQNVIPVYLYYVTEVGSTTKQRPLNSKDVEAMQFIAMNLSLDPDDKDKSLGFTIISPKIEFEENEVEKVAQQIDMIKQYCPDSIRTIKYKDSGGNNKVEQVKTIQCAVMVVPKNGNEKALDAIMQLKKDKIDIVGIYNLPKYRAPSADGKQYYYFVESGEEVFSLASNYSKYVLQKYSKPSLLAYVGVPYYKYRMTYGDADGNKDPVKTMFTRITWEKNEDSTQKEETKTVTWDDTRTKEYAQQLFRYIPLMAESGIIGMAYFQLHDGEYYAQRGAKTGSYEGNYGLMYLDKDSKEYKQKNPFFHAFFKGCKDYYGEELYKEISASSSSDYKEGDFFEYVKNEATSTDSSGGSSTPSTKIPSVPEYKEVKTFSQVPLVFSGDGKTSDKCNIYASIETFREMYEEQVSLKGVYEPPKEDYSTDVSKLRRLFGCDYCLGFPPKEYLDLLGVLSYWKPSENEEQMKKCKAWDYEIRENSEECDLDPLLVKAVIDVESSFRPCMRTCNPSKTSTDSCEESNKQIPSGSTGCAFGLMQLYKTAGGDYDPIKKAWCSSQDLGDTFDPFNPQHNICYGSLHLCNDYDAATEFLEDDKAQKPGTSTKTNIIEMLGLSGNPEKSKDKWMITFFALSMYNRGEQGAKDLFWEYSGKKECPKVGSNDYCADPDGDGINVCCTKEACSANGIPEHCCTDIACCSNPGGSTPGGDSKCCGAEMKYPKYVCKCKDTGQMDSPNYPCLVIKRFAEIYGDKEDPATGCWHNCEFRKFGYSTSGRCGNLVDTALKYHENKCSYGNAGKCTADQCLTGCTMQCASFIQSVFTYTGGYTEPTGNGDEICNDGKSIARGYTLVNQEDMQTGDIISWQFTPNGHAGIIWINDDGDAYIIHETSGSYKDALTGETRIGMVVVSKFEDVHAGIPFKICRAPECK